MQRLAVGLLVALLCLGAIVAVQLAMISTQLNAREQSRIDMLEARIIVLEKHVERLKAKEELAHAMPSLQDHPE